MKHFFLIVLLFGFHFATTAQEAEQHEYELTATAKKYYSNPAFDSLLKQTTAILFTENHISSDLFEKKYPTVKSLLFALSYYTIKQSFSMVETSAQFGFNSNKGATGVLANKQLYAAALLDIVRSVFLNNRTLSQYINANTGDWITRFNSTIIIGKDAVLSVKEEISIHNGEGGLNLAYGNDSEMIKTGAFNNEIQRGIVRAFPLYYVNQYHLFQNTSFDLKNVLRDGVDEKYHTEKKANGIWVFTGSKDFLLDRGEYTYTLDYTSNHQLKLQNNFDELYWNVTGNGWSFRIDTVQCTLLLPIGTSLLSARTYIGLQGDTSSSTVYQLVQNHDSVFIVFKAARSLLPKEGFTIAVSWPKGFVETPSWWSLIPYYIWNNKAIFFLPLAALLSAIFCFIFWVKYGRDPAKGSIVVLFEPPAGYSPAALGYIYFRRFTQQLTAATMVDAVVRNIIRIEVTEKGSLMKHPEYQLFAATGPRKEWKSDYEAFETDVLKLEDSSIKKGKYNDKLASLNKKIQIYCDKNYRHKDGYIGEKDKGLFALNSSYMIVPALLCIIAGIWAFFGGLIKSLEMNNPWQLAYFFGGIVGCVLVLKIFARLLPVYSTAGRKLKDGIEGFRVFLSTTEEDRFNTMNPPEKNIQLYEQYLPFAIALDCAIAWGKKFESILDTASYEQIASTSFSNYIRLHGNSFGNSFSGSIASASNPPSSSGGGSSFGGGSSGGGGGGGGGGGW